MPVICLPEKDNCVEKFVCSMLSIYVRLAGGQLRANHPFSPYVHTHTKSFPISAKKRSRNETSASKRAQHLSLNYSRFIITARPSPTLGIPSHNETPTGEEAGPRQTHLFAIILNSRLSFATLAFSTQRATSGKERLLCSIHPTVPRPSLGLRLLTFACVLIC